LRQQAARDVAEAGDQQSFHATILISNCNE